MGSLLGWHKRKQTVVGAVNDEGGMSGVLGEAMATAIALEAGELIVVEKSLPKNRHNKSNATRICLRERRTYHGDSLC